MITAFPRQKRRRHLLVEQVAGEIKRNDGDDDPERLAYRQHDVVLLACLRTGRNRRIPYRCLAFSANALKAIGMFATDEHPRVNSSQR